MFISTTSAVLILGTLCFHAVINFLGIVRSHFRDSGFLAIMVSLPLMTLGQFIKDGAFSFRDELQLLTYFFITIGWIAYKAYKNELYSTLISDNRGLLYRNYFAYVIVLIICGLGVVSRLCNVFIF